MRKLIVVLPLFASVCFSQEGQITVATPAGTTHELVLVPAGPFEMGTEDGQADAKPVHTVELDAYYIDKYEVTNAQYEAYVQTAGGEPSLYVNDEFVPGTSTVESRTGIPMSFLTAPEKPIFGVSGTDAQGYCAWAGLRLPTEAEWEKAARGTDGRRYPWGDEEPTCARAVMDDGGRGCGEGITRPVGATPGGVSPYGAHDMAGNVQEWVSDWYDSDYYASSPSRNPTGPSSGTMQVTRGGRWRDRQFNLRTTTRSRNGSVSRTLHLGFRCAQTEGEVRNTLVTPQSWGEVKSDVR